MAPRPKPSWLCITSAAAALAAAAVGGLALLPAATEDAERAAGGAGPGAAALGSWGVVGRIDEIRHTPTAREFWTVNVDEWRPLMVRGAATSMPATAGWDAAALVQRFGDMVVRTERAQEDRRAGSQRGGMPLSELLRRGAAGEDLYAVSNVPHAIPHLHSHLPAFTHTSTHACTPPRTPPRTPALLNARLHARLPAHHHAPLQVPHAMAADLHLPPFLLCGATSEEGEGRASPADGSRQKVAWATPIDEHGLWVASRPTSSQLHFDQTNILNCLLRGEKRWLFFDTRTPEVV